MKLEKKLTALMTYCSAIMVNAQYAFYAGGLDFKSLAGQNWYSVANGLPPLQHLKSSCIVLTQCRVNSLPFRRNTANIMKGLVLSCLFLMVCLLQSPDYRKK